MRRATISFLALAIAGGGVIACGDDDSAGARSEPAPARAVEETATASGTESAPRAAPAARRSTVATGLNVPWGIAFLPGDDALVAERETGRIVRIARRTGRRSLAQRLGQADSGTAEGGLLGIAVSPTYERDRLVYAYMTTASDNRIVRFRLGGRPRPILTGLAKADFHNGGRIAFGPDGKLYAGVGDAARPARGQDRSSQNGKILRMNPDGSVPASNPFPGSRVWSLGHRNVQGLAFDRRGRLWAIEFGQDRFDEVNLIRKGGNYGWPAVEGRGGTRGGRFVNPQVTWTTDEASPSGAAVVGRSLYVAALRGERLWRVPLRGARAGRPRASLRGRYGRLRTAVRAPDGSLWISTSNRDGRGDARRGDDRIIRIRGAR